MPGSVLAPLMSRLPPAEDGVSAANARTAAAVARRDALYTAITDSDIATAQANLNQALMDLEDLQVSMGAIINWGDQNAANVAPGDPSPLSAGEPLALQIELAELNVAAAEAYLNDLLDGPNPDQLGIENARINLAYAQAAAARARLDLLLAQPFPEDIKVAEAQVAQVVADVDSAVARLEQASLFAPFDGTITAVTVDNAEFVGPGQAIIQIGDLSTLRVETTDLNEIDVARVQVGDTVEVTFDALEGVSVQGTVTHIAPKAEAGAGVNYTVIIELDNIPSGIRWGMTAFVDIFVSE